MESDDRFKHLVNDPRFKTIRNKQKKLRIDDRFKSMFTDEKFTLKYSKDKRGWKQNKTSGDDLRKYYSIEDGPTNSYQSSNSSKESDDDTEIYHSDSDETSSSDTSESESESDTQLDVSLEYDWRLLDEDAERADRTSSRLAIQNLDWDRLNAKDLYILLNSIRPPISVKIFVSEFGKERIKREQLEGPQEFLEPDKLNEEDEENKDEEEYNMLKEKIDALENPKPKSYRINEYEDADDEMNLKNKEIREKVRAYQLNKLKYYFAIVVFDSVESAEIVYKELDGMEFEGSSLDLDLRFVPDEITFGEEDLRDECNKLPDLTTYKTPQFISSALQQTTVRFTWDETDLKRQEQLRKAYTKEELEKDDLEAYLASETDSGDESVSDVSPSRYKELIKSLEDDEIRRKKEEVDIEWEIEEKASDDKVSDEEESDESGSQNEEELDLLVSEKKESDFKFDPEDVRFKAIYESGLYNIDPSHHSFKPSQALEIMARKKQEKRRQMVPARDELTSLSHKERASER